MKKSNQIGRAALAVILGISMTLTACSTDWVKQAEQVVAALIPASTNIVTLVAMLQGKSISVSDLRTIQNAGTQAAADLQLIQALIEAYEKADESAKAGILNQVQTAIGSVQGNLQGLLPALHIQNQATQTKISAVVGIVLSEVQSLAAIVPLVSTAASPMKIARAAGARKALPLTANEFVSSFNSTLTAKTGNVELDRAAAGLQIHVHGKVARVASAGALK
jgi:hypothetical protein